MTRWSVLTRSEPDNTLNSSKRVPCMDCRVKPGKDDKENRSRDTSCPSPACDYARKIDSPPARMVPKSGVRFSDEIMRRKGRRSSERRMPTIAAHTGKRHRLPMLQARLRATFEGAPAFRRFTAALATD
jgi:hypothetical protein